MNYFLGLAYLQTGKIDAARPALAVTFGVPPDGAAAHLLAAQMLIRLNLDETAAAELKRALEKNPRLPNAQYLLGQMALFRGRLDESADWTRRELDVNPGNAMAWYRLGDVYVREAKWNEAITMLQRSLWINPFYSGPYILLGRAYMKTERTATAEGMLRRGIQYDPNNASAHYLLAQLLQQLGRDDEAKAEFAIAEKLQGQPGDECERAANSSPRRGGLALLFLPNAVLAAGPSPDVASPFHRHRWRGRAHAAVHLRRRRSQALHHRDQRRRRRVVDYDRDGWLDALVLSGTRLADGERRDGALGRGAHEPAVPQPGRWHVCRRHGPRRAAAHGVGLGVCAGDYDNDGWLDLFRHLLRPQTFCIATTAADVSGRDRGRRPRWPDVRWGSGCTFIDYDRDGRLDLFVSNYLRFDLTAATEPGKGANCLWKGIPVNCGPKGLPTDTNLLYRNRGDGTFEDVSAASGIARVTGRYPMTAAAADFDEDGWPDIYVASDSTAAICTATTTTARSPTSRSKAARRTASTAMRRPAWASPSATSTATGASTS